MYLVRFAHRLPPCTVLADNHRFFAGSRFVEEDAIRFTDSIFALKNIML